MLFFEGQYSWVAEKTGTLHLANFNKLRLWKNDWPFADSIFLFIFIKENVILTKILLNEICSCAQQTLHPYNLDNGLAPNSYRTIVWTNNGLVYSSF